MTVEPVSGKLEMGLGTIREEVAYYRPINANLVSAMLYNSSINVLASNKLVI